MINNHLETTPEQLTYHCAAFLPNNLHTDNMVLLIRGRVGQSGNLTYYINPNEGNHHMSHVHARLKTGESMSINILTCEIIKHGLPSKFEKEAVQYVKNNKIFLIQKWNEFHPELKI